MSAGRLGCEPPLGVAQALVDAFELTARQQYPCVRIAQHGAALELFVGKRVEPAAQLDILLGASQRRPLELDQVSRVPEVAG